MTEKQAARATDDNSFHDEAGWHALAKIKSWNPCAVAGLGEALWIILRSFWATLLLQFKIKMAPPNPPRLQIRNFPIFLIEPL